MRSLIDKKSAKKGSSTVFLALVFTVIMMLFTAVCALLCYKAEKTNIKRNLDIAVESEFGRFYRPLFDDYRLLYYMDSDEDIFDADVLSYFMKNQEETPGILRLKPSGFYTEEKSYAADDKCSNVLEQMTEGIVYTLGEDAVNSMYEKIKERLNVSEKNDKVLDKASDESSDIAEDAYTEERVIKLLRLVEGVYIDKGRLKCEKLYVKCGAAGEISQASSGIDSPLVWETVKSSKWSITDELKKLKDNDVSGVRFKGFLKKIGELYEVTKKAYELASDIDNDISDKLRKSCICDIRGIKEKLYDNMNILKGILESEGGVKEYEQMLGSYHVKDIYFDYSTLSLKKEDNPVKNLKPDAEGIVSFLLDHDEDISSSFIEETGIYEKTAGSGGAKKDASYDFKKTEEISGYLDSCKSGAAVSDIADTVKLNLYINEYFSDFCGKDNENDKERALAYEKEYIIGGKKSDRDNLGLVANKILLMRTGMSFVYLVSDKEKSNLAYMTAAAIVGFTGMDALVRCTQYIILAGWAYEDACVDVSALLRGKKIPYLKKKENLNIEYQELLLFDKELVKKKAESIDYRSGVGYSDFLGLFVALKKRDVCLYRCMDVIHYNMKLRHSKLFSFQNAMYRAKVYIACNYPYFQEAETEYCYR